MDDKLIYQMVKIIEHNGNILDITQQGYEFGQVMSFVDKLKELKYIQYDESLKIIVSEIGKAFLRGYESNNDIKRYSKWILPQGEMWGKPLNKLDIYIPKE